MNYTITVGIPSYNRPELLKRAIQSVVTQTYANLDILISDNGSTDPQVRLVIEEFLRSDSRIRCQLHPVNKGSFFNFATVLNDAKGKYFIWLADDDYWDAEFLEGLYESATRSGAALTYGRAEIVDIDVPEKDRVIKEMSTTDNCLAAMVNFIRLDTDSVFYGLFLTETGKRISSVLRYWSMPRKMVSEYPSIEYDFVSYAFIFGLLSTGGFCNASSKRIVHFVGGRATFKNSHKLTWRHLKLFLVNIFVHLQMLVRFMTVAFFVRSVAGVVFSPIAVLYLFFRRIFLIVNQRIKLFL